jgi:hypothetical protein|tara:strand:+ start:918 stop:1139 length:222 start_codon:yes stop_codon:yes gene_type:complete
MKDWMIIFTNDGDMRMSTTKATNKQSALDNFLSVRPNVQPLYIARSDTLISEAHTTNVFGISALEPRWQIEDV